MKNGVYLKESPQNSSTYIVGTMNMKYLLPLLYLLPIACKSVKTPAPATQEPAPETNLYYDTPCVKAEFDAEKATLSYGPEEWGHQSPAGFYSGESGNASQDLIVIPVHAKDNKGKPIITYSTVTSSQGDLLWTVHTEVKYPFYYHRGILEQDEESDNPPFFASYGVLKMGKKQPQVLVNDEAFPYTRYELRDVKRQQEIRVPHGIFRRMSNCATEFDGICIAKYTMYQDTGALISLTFIEQTSPESVPVLTHYQGLQVKDNELCDASGKCIFSLSNDGCATTLTDEHGQEYREMEKHFHQEPERASYAP